MLAYEAYTVPDRFFFLLKLLHFLSYFWNSDLLFVHVYNIQAKDYFYKY